MIRADYRATLFMNIEDEIEKREDKAAELDDDIDILKSEISEWTIELKHLTESIANNTRKIKIKQQQILTIEADIKRLRAKGV
jgi:chromosome segregation ATPase